VENISIKIILLVLFCAILGAFGQLFFKLASSDFSLSVEGVLRNWKFLIGAFLYASSAILFVYSLKHGNLSILYPLIATSYIWVALLSFFILKEPVSMLNVAGIGLIIAGIALVVQ
jgi:drug/metabolite transporter (DMT)-like permease